MRRLVIAIIAALATTFALTAPMASASDVAHEAVVSANPVDYTPHVLNGEVNAIEVVDDTVIVGGSFSRAQGARAFFGRERHNLFAFDARTGEIKLGFRPQVNGPVHALASGPGDTVFVGGAFTYVNGLPQRGLAQIHISTGHSVSTFRGTSLDGGQVNALAAHGSWLYVGGRFPGIGGTHHRALARVDARSGDVDTDFDFDLAKPRRGTLSVKDLALSPDGATLVIDGNFTRVSREPRHQIAMIRTGAPTPRLVNWATDAYTDRCMRIFHTYMRGIDFAPDGSYFVVVTTGGDAHDPTSMCDSAARWETAARGTNIQPMWVNRTGGDSLYSVAVTGAAVYVGGHQRWMSNPHGNDDAGRGAVARPGIAALDPRTGAALSWNPTRTRGHGVQDLTVTPYGLFVGSDTEELGHEYHGRIGMFPVR